MKHPVNHYEQNRDVYDRISEQVQQTTDYFAQAGRPEQKLLLNQAVTFALISAQTSVPIHEKGYLNALEASDFEEIEQGLLDAGVNYYRNKAKYIFHNMTEPDYEMVLDLYDDGRIDEMHRAIADEFKGVSTRKAAFAMAKVVTTDKMCLDTNVCQRAGIEPDEIYNGVVVDKYEKQCQSVKDQWPDLHDELGAFMFQWVLFDSNKETVTCHDVWFNNLPESSGVNAVGWS
jgi:thermostable 8-oxoguanine DNA glycosylase